MNILSNIVDDNKFTSEDVPRFEEKLFFEGDKRRVNLERFAVLLVLSTIIATYGVIGDSVATVIGAMIIAPLMRPIMATAAALVMGRMNRALRSGLVVIAGVATVIGIAALLTALNSSHVISFEINSQIIGRISPRLIDLYAALACGVAGAFAMSREDVADSLPGVAISISLVPPLCVAGIGLAEGEWVAAWGAMLLFLTNFLSILLAGGGTLALLGLSAASNKKLNADARRKAFIFITIGILLVAVPLGITTWQVFEENLAEGVTKQVAQEWVDQTGYEVSRIEADGDRITLTINGSGNRPTLSELGNRVGTSLNRLVNIRLIVLPSEHEDYVAERE
jgi:uncharacterized hydrophobic protein (TIGR00271 family)